MRADEIAALRQERSQLVERFSNIQSGIRRTQAAALDAPGVSAVQDSFYAEVRRFMQREYPEAVELLDRAERIGADIERVSGPVEVAPDAAVTREQQQAVVGELQETERDLRPYLQRAMTDPVVQAAFSVLQDSLIAEMTRLDPGAPSTIQRMSDTAEEIRQVDMRIAELQSYP
jgi:DNA replication initiation complex subunit (GINS family)